MPLPKPHARGLVRYEEGGGGASLLLISFFLVSAMADGRSHPGRPDPLGEGLICALVDRICVLLAGLDRLN
jgi:hypothetical protein